MSPDAALDLVRAATEREIVALLTGDLDALEAATNAKLEALPPLRAARIGELDRERVAETARLNREATRQLNLARARWERRRRALARTVDQEAVTAYRADGQLTARLLRG